MRLHYDSHDYLKVHLKDLIAAYEVEAKAQDAQRSSPLWIHLQNLEFDLVRERPDSITGRDVGE